MKIELKEKYISSIIATGGIASLFLYLFIDQNVDLAIASLLMLMLSMSVSIESRLDKLEKTEEMNK